MPRPAWTLTASRFGTFHRAASRKASIWRHAAFSGVSCLVTPRQSTAIGEGTGLESRPVPAHQGIRADYRFAPSLKITALVGLTVGRLSVLRSQVRTCQHVTRPRWRRPPPPKCFRSRPNQALLQTVLQHFDLARDSCHGWTPLILAGSPHWSRQPPHNQRPRTAMEMARCSLSRDGTGTFICAGVGTVLP